MALPEHFLQEQKIRKSNRLISYDYSKNGMYFITICSSDKKCLFGKILTNKIQLNKIGKIIEKAIEQINCHYDNVSVDKYVVMPNHVHMIIALTAENHDCVNSNIPTIVGSMKRLATKQAGIKLWQKSFHDHVIRNQISFDQIWEYIDTNIIRWEMDELYCEEIV